MKNILTTLLILLSMVSYGQTKTQQTKVQIDVENEHGREQYKLKLEQEVDGKTEITEKTYHSMEEMKNDPELEGVNIGFMQGSGELFSTKKGDTQVIIKFDDEEGSSEGHRMMFISDGEEGDDVNIEVTVDEDGTKHIFKNGEEIDMDELEKSGDYEVIFISEGGDETDVKSLGEDAHKMMVISENEEGEGEVKIEVTVDEDGTKHVFRNGEEIDFDELHKSGENVFAFKADGGSTFKIEEKMEVEVTVDENGNHRVTVNGKEVDYDPDSYREKKNNQLYIGKGNMKWVEESEDGKQIKKEIILLKKERKSDTDVMVKVRVDHIVLHMEDVNAKDKKAFSIEDNKALKLDEFNFYPNPSNGSFQLSFQGKERATLVRVTDINGKEMYMEEIQDFGGAYNKEINLTGLKKGIYLLQIVQGSKAVNKKIVIE